VSCVWRYLAYLATLKAAKKAAPAGIQKGKETPFRVKPGMTSDVRGFGRSALVGQMGRPDQEISLSPPKYFMNWTRS
jgi:hypothetical protein